MSTDPTNRQGLNQPSQDDVFAASPPFASAGDGFVDTPVPGQIGTPGPHVSPTAPHLEQGQVTCLQIHANLGFYLDGELDQASSAAIQAHLGVCGACQTAQAFQMQFRSTVAAKALDPMPEDVRARITKALGF